MNNRLQQFLAAENITQAQFADSINVARAGVSHIIAGRNRPGYEFILSTMKRYPDLNIEWLLTGKGKMYKSSQQAEAEDRTEVRETTAAPPAPDGNDLFADIYEDSPTIGYSGPQQAPDTNKAATTDIKATVEAAEHAVRQRKATKIIVFFDDGTFQEF